MKYTFVLGMLAVILLSIPTDAIGQVVYTYCEAHYDENTNTVSAIAQVFGDYTVNYYYESAVELGLYVDGQMVAFDVQPSGSIASVAVSAQPGKEYVANATGFANAHYYQLVYPEDWCLYDPVACYFGGPYPPYWSAFFDLLGFNYWGSIDPCYTPGYRIRRCDGEGNPAPQWVLIAIYFIGNAFDSVNVPYSLTINTPTANSRFALNLTSVAIDFKANANFSGCSVSWQVNETYTTSGSRGPFENNYSFSNAAGQTIAHNFNGEGGKVTINASCKNPNGQTINANPVTIYIVGTDIPDSDITARLLQLYSGRPTPRLMTGIAMVESAYAQFKTRTLYGISDKWPVESYDGGSHIGLMQMPVRMDYAFNWQINTQAAVNLFNGDKMSFARAFNSAVMAKHPGLRSLTDGELENVALEYYGPQAGNCSRTNEWCYYTPNSNGTDWVVTNDPAVMSYADNVRASMK